MEPDVYDRLARFLDGLPGGFPATETGLELKILRQLFSPEEAELALHLSMIGETARVIAHRAGRSASEVGAVLDRMERKGLVFATHGQGEEPTYSASNFVVGIYEFQVNKLNEAFATDVEAYLPHLLEPEIWRQAPQLRTIPIGESLTPEVELLPYERAERLIQSHTKFSVAPCVCRQERALLGHRCDKPLETCLSFDAGADFYVRNGMGRYISEEEALGILSLAEEAGLVLQPSASQEAAFLCCCCGCCCGVLATLKRHPAPADLVHSPFQAVLDEELCDGCQLCLDRCQMEALEPIGTTVFVDTDRCIGCGLCIPACPNEALSLLRKPGDEQRNLPRTWAEANIHRGKIRGVISNRRLAEMFVRSKTDRALANKRGI